MYCLTNEHVLNEDVVGVFAYIVVTVVARFLIICRLFRVFHSIVIEYDPHSLIEVYLIYKATPIYYLSPFHIKDINFFYKYLF